MTLAQLLGTCCGVGHFRPAPGTWGSLLALPLTLLLHQLGGFPLLAAVTVIATVAGYWAATEMTRGQEDLDPSEFVLDELAGQMLALWALSLPAWLHGLDITALWPGWIAGFLLFRLFDIWKPGPVGWADRKKGPFGVMTDDLIAGVMAAIGIVLLAGLSHGLLGL
ncbi:phosphatidylglycerophosphatase A family protein [Tritonibacter horizontis]|uniref:Phosphatidylglycerophosphatase A n=1 Tax=Tritonibacter horizontis TaxID=1768241 RepID=A0A132BWG7_9RHOB|nr:phosphatidylglycerophosphatase A [Tritonibacter horizontis]KUP92546.1 phosphatidylglycerophosphatase A [Tritonibacter horizontis]